MFIREAGIEDIPQLQVIRRAVTENILSNEALVTKAHYEEYLTQRGKGWLCICEGQVAGFAIVSVADSNVWALFVHPDFEGKGIGKKLQYQMLQWYFGQTGKTIWLSTEANSRAAEFYRKTGWKELSWYNEQELKFEMTYEIWKERSI